MARAAAKPRPVQARSRATRELLLRSAAELLAEVGVERLSSNLICERAGVTPPAFYRYFADKYAVLAELGEQLMEAQNQAIIDLLGRGGTAAPEEELRALLLETVRVTKAFPGGPWILRVLRAVPALQHIRIGSHRRMSRLIADAALSLNPRADRARVAVRARLLVDLGYAAVELMFDEPKLNRAETAAAAARGLAALAGDLTR